MAKIQVTPRGKEILDAYVQISSKLKTYPTRIDMLDAGYRRTQIRDQFGSLTKLKSIARKLYPEIFQSMIEDRLYDSTRRKAVRHDLKGFKRFVITAVVDGAPLHSKFYKSLKTYCKKNEAMLLLMPAGGPLKYIDPILVDDNWIFEDTLLNSNLMLNTIKILPRAVNPLTGLGRIAQRNQSQIVASPKQFLEFVAVGNHKIPHALMSTGAITEALYKTSKGAIRKVDTIANHDHTCGAIVVEIEDKKHFHFRQIQAERSGAFVDLGIYYDGSRISRMAPEAFIMGDLHVTETDLVALENWKEAVQLTGAKRLFIHDMFSGVSINHHEEFSHVKRAILANKGKMSLGGELAECAGVLDYLTTWVDRVYVVKSNHDEFLCKHYLQKGKYVNEPQNFSLCHELVGAMLNGNDPLHYGIETVIGLNSPGKVAWLERDDTFKIAGIELAAHGDGFGASAPYLERAYGNCVVGHSHSPKILRGFWQVGGTVPKLDYAKGPCKWVQTSCLVYPNGARQLINSIEGRFTTMALT